MFAELGAPLERGGRAVQERGDLGTDAEHQFLPHLLLSPPGVSPAHIQTQTPARPNILLPKLRHRHFRYFSSLTFLR